MNLSFEDIFGNKVTFDPSMSGGHINEDEKIMFSRLNAGKWFLLLILKPGQNNEAQIRTACLAFAVKYDKKLLLHENPYVALVVTKHKKNVAKFKKFINGIYTV